MRRGRRRIPFALAAVALALLAAHPHRGGPRPATAAAHERPNVVLVLADDERLDGDTVMRHVRDLLARRGVTFANYHVTTSLCGPSRASILQGEYSHTTGVYGNWGPHGYPAFDARSDLAVWLHRAGYETALVGKYLNDYTLYGGGAIPPGWDDWQAIDSVPEERYYDYSLDENGRVVRYGHAPADYSTTVLTRKAVAFVRRARGPFFLYFAPVTPHLPALPAPRDRGTLRHLAPLSSPSIGERDLADKPWAAWHRRLLNAGARVYGDHVRERQLESLLALDRSVAEIVAALRRRGVLGRTVILYTSDNGFLYGEHRLGGKIWPYEESTHVPLVVRTPWRAGDGTVNREPVLNVDLASTIAALAGVRPGSPQDGRSFLPFLHGRTIPWRKAYAIEYLGRSQLRVGGPPPYEAVHTQRYLYVAYRNGWRELYDLRHDPWELRDVAGRPSYAAVERRLAALLERIVVSGRTSPGSA